MIFITCKSLKINEATIRSSVIKDLSKYKTYVFTLRNTIKTSEANPKALHFSNGVDSNKGLTHEMIYLLRDPTTDEVLYLTSKSHKYIYDGGVFNDSLDFYKRFNVLNDIDNISIGKEKNNQFIFLDTKGRDYSTKVVFSFTEKDDVIKIDSISNNYPDEKKRIEEPFVLLDSVFSTSIKFRNNSKPWVYLWENKAFKRGGESFNDKDAYEKVNQVFINYPHFFVRSSQDLDNYDCYYKGFYYYHKKRKIRKVSF